MSTKPMLSPLVVAALAAAANFGSATGQEAGKTQPNPVAPVAAPPLPDAETLIILTRTALLSLNDAVQTGNFTVLRDLSAPGFQDANTAAKLSKIFTNLMQSGVDLAATATAAPQLTDPPAIDAKSGMLKIKGHFALSAARVDFSLAFQSVSDRWRLFGISVQPSPTVTATGEASAARAALVGKSAPAANANAKSKPPRQAAGAKADTKAK